jgi:hypothetical protein
VRLLLQPVEQVGYVEREGEGVMLARIGEIALFDRIAKGVVERHAGLAQEPAEAGDEGIAVENGGKLGMRAEASGAREGFEQAGVMARHAALAARARRRGRIARRLGNGARRLGKGGRGSVARQQGEHALEALGERGTIGADEGARLAEALGASGVVLRVVGGNRGLERGDGAGFGGRLWVVQVQHDRSSLSMNGGAAPSPGVVKPWRFAERPRRALAEGSRARHACPRGREARKADRRAARAFLSSRAACLAFSASAAPSRSALSSSAALVTRAQTRRL